MLSIGFLGVLSAAIAFVTWSLWVKTRNFSFLLGAIFLYYWSLYGAWAILTGYDFGSHSYLFDDLVSVNVDSVYSWTIGFYGAFVLAVLLAAYYFTTTGRSIRRLRVPKQPSILVIKSTPLVIISLVAGGLSYLLVSESLFLSSQIGRSVYQLVRMDNELGANFSLHAIVNRIALVPTAIALAAIGSGRDARYVVLRASWFNVLSLSLIAGLMVVLCLLLGNKNELLFAASFGILVYLGNARRPNWKRLTVLAMVGTLLFSAINSTRSKSLDEFTEGLNTDYLIEAFSSLGMTGETFAAHMSLYGVLDQKVPLVYGQSFVSLIASIVPRVLWEERPDDIYSYYVDSIDASVQQGFTIHHATGWYLNFGLLGLLAGAILLGWLWAYLYNLLQNSHYVETPLWRVFGTFAFWAFTANMPNIIRAGIEGYKGFLFHALVTPIAVLMLCCRMAILSPRLKQGFKNNLTRAVTSTVGRPIVRRSIFPS